MLRCHRQKVVRRKRLLVIVLTDMYLDGTLSYEQQFGEESALLHHLFEVLQDIGFCRDVLADRKIGGIGAKSICQLIFVGKLFQVIYLLLFHGSVFCWVLRYVYSDGLERKLRLVSL